MPVQTDIRPCEVSICSPLSGISGKFFHLLRVHDKAAFDIPISTKQQHLSCAFKHLYVLLTERQFWQEQGFKILLYHRSTTPFSSRWRLYLNDQILNEVRSIHVVKRLNSIHPSRYLVSAEDKLRLYWVFVVYRSGTSFPCVFNRLLGKCTPGKGPVPYIREVGKEAKKPGISPLLEI